MVLAGVLVQMDCPVALLICLASVSLTLGKSLGPFLHDYLGFLIAWRLNSKGVFQDVKAETADLIRSGLRIYTASFLPHSVDQSKAPPSPVQGKRK